MDSDKTSIQIRDYDKNPIVISNNFTSLLWGITFMLLADTFVIWAIFFSGAIDWSIDKSWIFIFKDEMSKSMRFSGMLFLLFIGNIGALHAFYRALHKPRKINFYNAKIESDKSFNDLTELNFENILEIKKSPYPLLLTGIQNKGLTFFIASLLTYPFYLLTFILTILVKLICISVQIFSEQQWVMYKYPYLIIFSKTSNRVINIPLFSAKEYQLIQQYFLSQQQIDIDKTVINFKLFNLKEDEKT